MKKTTRCILHSAVCSALALGAGSVHAQTTEKTSADIKLERIVVTGSQLPRTDQETPSPVQVITAAEIRASGYTSVSEVLRDVTANGMGTVNQGFNRAFHGGASGISLRGLTLGGTLLLIDGRRMAPYPLADDGQRSFFDLSSIPFEAVERIEILKDGASAVYGSDAVAGVINVILKKSFQGTSLSAESGTTQHGGGTTTRVAVTHGFGSAASGGNGYISLEYRKQEKILVNQRSGEWTRMDWRGVGGEDLRPGAVNAGVSLPRLTTAYLQIPGSSIDTAANFAFYPGCTYAAMSTSQCRYRDTWSAIQPASENLNVLAAYNTQVAAGWDLNLNAAVFNAKNQQIGEPQAIPYGSFGGNIAAGPRQIARLVGAIDNFTVPANYPGNTLGVPAWVIGSFTTGQPYTTDFDTTSTRLVAELSGLLSGWEIKSAVGFTRIETKTEVTNALNPGNLNIALNTSDPARRFLLGGGNSAAVTNFVSPKISNKQTSELSFVDASAARELMKLAGGPLSLGLGISYITKALNAPNSKESQDGSMATIVAFAEGKEKSTALFAELAAPVSKSLELAAALRYDHFDTYGNSATPKFGFKFSPTPKFALRGTVSKGFRAPAATETSDAGSLFGFNGIRDPQLCPTLNADGTPNLTAATNVPAFCNYGVPYLQGTNKSIQPEKSTSYTLGLILEPVKGWSTTLDYYKIELKNQIVSATSLASFNPTDFAVRASPQQVTFGDGRTGLSRVGPIAYVNAPFVNANTTATSGLELESRYQFNLTQYGKLTAAFQYTHTLNYDITVNGVKYKLAGTHGPAFVGGNTGNPRGRAQTSFTWEQGATSVSVTTNYISSFGVTDPSLGINTCADGTRAFTRYFQTVDAPSQYCKVKAFYYTNLSAQHQLNKAWTLRLSVTNLFDANPPVDFSTYGSAGQNPSSSGTGLPYNPAMHQIGAVGRAYSVGVNYKF